MIGAATTALLRLGLLDASHRPRFNIAISRGSTVAADVTVGSGRFLHLKASAHGSLETEYVATLRAAAIHDSSVPRAVAHVAEAGWQLLFTEGRRFAVLQPWAMDRAVARGLVEFLARGADTAMSPRPGHHSRLLARCLADVSAPSAKGVLRRWLSGDRARTLDSLAIVPQHGDLTANNIGVSGRSVVVFDWEDYGAVELPGFDVATLLLSLTGFNAARALAALDGAEEPLGRLVQSALARVGIERAPFRESLPLHVAVFLALKSHYAAGVRQRAAAALEHLLLSATAH